MGSRFKYPFQTRMPNVPDQLTMALGANFREALTTREAQGLIDAAVDEHVNDTADAHSASAVSVTETGLIIPSANTVQGALSQVEAYVQNLEETYEQHHHDERYLGPAASMYQNSAQAIAENTATYLVNHTKNFQTVAGMVDTANNQIVIPRAGLYRCTAGVSFVAPGVNIHQIVVYIYLNGIQVVGAGKPATASATTPVSVPVTRLMSLAANEVLKPAAYWYAGGVGGTYATTAGNFYTFIEVEWVGPTPNA